LYEAFSHAELDEERFEVGVEIVVEEFADAQLANACVREANPDVSCFGCFGRDFDSQYDGRILDLAAEFVFKVLQVAG
jgi:hypothetical protein